MLQNKKGTIKVYKYTHISLLPDAFTGVYNIKLFESVELETDWNVSKDNCFIVFQQYIFDYLSTGFINGFSTIICEVVLELFINIQFWCSEYLSLVFVVCSLLFFLTFFVYLKPCSLSLF